MSAQDSLFSLRYTRNRIVVHWLAVFVLAAPAAFIGWQYTVGIVAGMFVMPLYRWRNGGE